MATTKVSLKLFIVKKRQRVLFAEADNEFVDFLLSIFILPVGVVTRLLREGGGMVGCLPNLYRSYENLSANHIKTNKIKPVLLEPKVIMPGAKPPLLLPNVTSTFLQLYRCPNPKKYDICNSYATADNSTMCPHCNSKMDRIVTFVDPPSVFRASFTREEGYVKGSVTYIVMNDLEVMASSSGTLIVSLLIQFNVNDIRDIEERVVDVGMDEVYIPLIVLCLLCINYKCQLLIFAVS